MKILLAAEEAAGVQALKLLEKSEHDLVAVLTSSGSDSALRAATVESVAKSMGYEVLPAIKVKDSAFAEQLKTLEIDILLNVHSLYLIHADVLTAASFGAFNLHPGPLPRYAGMNAPSWAIFHDEASHGVTLHWIEAGVDTGAVAYQALFDLTPKDTGLSVSTKCVRLGIPLIERLLEQTALDPSAVPSLEQDRRQRSYYQLKDRPFNAQMPWREEATLLERLVRASDFYPLPSPWGYPQASLDGQTLGIMKVSLTGEKTAEAPGTLRKIDNEVRVAAGDEWLSLERLEHNGRAVKPSEVLEGGQRFSLASE